MIFDQILDHFTSMWEQHHPGLHCLIGDNLASHRDLKILQKALDHGIYLTFLVEGTTHWSQPLDNLLFARLKQEIGQLARHLAFHQVFTQEELFSLVAITLESACRAFSKKVIVKAFQETGLWPLNKAKIEELARINHNPANKSFVPSERD